MKHIDEKFKDNSPIKTVENIRAMLEKHGFEVEEKWTDSGIEHCHSMRLTIAGTTIGTNGKGVTTELTRASGHAEFMERLQSGYLGIGTLDFPDMTQITREELLEESYLAQIAYRIEQTEEQSFCAEDLADACLAYGEMESCKALPFLDVMTGKKVNFPYQLLGTLYGTNGLAAGNSVEEAMVQGFSEIIERYCQRFFLEGKLTPPDVPEDYLAKCETAYSVIQQVRQAGFDVIVKDCSMGEGYPVIATAIIHKKDRSCRVMFGASPVFEIALERSLTEVFQGYAIQRIPFVPGFFTGKKRAANDVDTAFIGGWVNYPLSFYAQKASYEFKPFEDRSGLTNKDLLAYILRYLKRTNRTMLVRDLSHLGFHTYRIVVPGMSELRTFVYVGENSLWRLSLQSRAHRTNLKKASVQELDAYKRAFEIEPTRTADSMPSFVRMTKIPLKLEPHQDSFLTLMSVAYAHWATDDRKQAFRYAQMARKFAGAKLKGFMECLCQMLELMVNGATTDEAVELMARFYDPIMLEMTRRTALSANPFENFLFVCDMQCETCAHAKRCKYPEKLSVTARVNKAVAAFDIEAAFARLRECFGC